MTNIQVPSYEKVVEDALRQGKKYATDNMRKYDVEFFAKAMWRIEAVAQYTPRGPGGQPVDQALLSLLNDAISDVNLAVLVGNKKAASSSVEKVVRIAHRLDINLPMPKKVPLPDWAKD